MNDKEMPKSKTRLYRIWNGMKQRCFNPNATSYYRYGERGIRVCEEWENSFENFKDWAYKHGYNDSLTIDRIDNDGNYCPENCQWLTNSENTAKVKFTRTANHYARAFEGTLRYAREKDDERKVKSRIDGLNRIIEAIKDFDKYEIDDVLSFVNWMNAAKEAKARKCEFDRIERNKERLLKAHEERKANR